MDCLFYTEQFLGFTYLCRFLWCVVAILLRLFEFGRFNWWGSKWECLNMVGLLRKCFILWTLLLMEVNNLCLSVDILWVFLLATFEFMFYGFLFCAVRAVLFGFHAHVFLLHPKVRICIRFQWSSGDITVFNFEKTYMLSFVNFIVICMSCWFKSNGFWIDSSFNYPKFLWEIMQALCLILLDLPGLLFFSAYTLLVLFWAEIYHQASKTPIKKMWCAFTLF